MSVRDSVEKVAAHTKVEGWGLIRDEWTALFPEPELRSDEY